MCRLRRLGGGSISTTVAWPYNAFEKHQSLPGDRVWDQEGKAVMTRRLARLRLPREGDNGCCVLRDDLPLHEFPEARAIDGGGRAQQREHRIAAVTVTVAAPAPKETK